MAARYHIRVCAAGTKRQIDLVLLEMMRNAALYEDHDDCETPRMPSTREMTEAIHDLARHEGGDPEGFLYEMLVRSPFGSADQETSRMLVKETQYGAWTICFDYHSANPFQAEDWQKLQRAADGVIICAQYAGHELAREKGRLLLAGGRVLDNWDCMEECWLWLSYRYLCGGTEADLPETIRRIRKELRDDDNDLTVEELLIGCETNLRAMTEALAYPQRISDALYIAEEEHRWNDATDQLITIAEGELWEVEREPLWLACLEEARNAWNGRL